MVPLCGGGAGARLLRMAGAARRLLLLSAARGSGSQAGGSPYTRGKALAVKKRGYDITRNPHLNKCTCLLPRALLCVAVCGRPASSACLQDLVGNRIPKDEEMSLSMLNTLAAGKCAEDPRSGCISRALSQ